MPNFIADESKFGQKLMEKMGWSKGKGLGLNQDGNVDIIRVQQKQDTVGMFFLCTYLLNRL